MTVIDLWTVQIIREDDGRIRGCSTATMDEVMAEMQENLTDLLPDGWQASIRRWDNPGTEDENDE